MTRGGCRYRGSSGSVMEMSTGVCFSTILCPKPGARPGVVGYIFFVEDCAKKLDPLKCRTS